MTKIVFSTVLLLLSCYFSYSQEQAPGIEWIEPYSGGNRGGSITLFPAPNTLFALIKGQNTNSGSASISKFSPDGLVKNQYIGVEGGSSNVPYMLQFPSQDGGVLVYLVSNRALKRYNNSLNLNWEKTVDFSLQNATPTLVNGFYLLTNTFTTNNHTTTELKRMKDDGSIEWSIDVTAFMKGLGGIRTSSDDGIIFTTGSDIRKYSPTGQLIWSNNNIPGENYLYLTTSSSSIIYLLTYNNPLDTRNVIQINTSDGNANWTIPLPAESIIDFERTSDNGCVFSTNKGLYKYNSTGDLQWKNTDFSTAIITTTDDGKIFVIKNNAITKLTFTNEQVWTKSFNHDYYIIEDINGASDAGVYVTAVKNVVRFNNAPDFLLFKLASPNTPCKTSIHITSDSSVYCGPTNMVISSKIGTVSLEYINLLTGLGFQWKRNGMTIPSATSYSYTATQSGNYSLTVTQNNCETTSSPITLSQIILPQPSISQSNDSLISSASVGNKWYFNTNELPLASQKIKFTEVGNYQVKVAEKGCESTLSAVFRPIILTNEQESTYIQVYPNPTSDKAFIRSSKAFTYQLVDVTGRLLNQSTNKGFVHVIDLNRFSSGNYFVILQEDNGNSIVRKLSVNH